MKFFMLPLIAAGLLFGCGDDTSDRNKRTPAMNAEAVKRTQPVVNPLEKPEGSRPAGQNQPTAPGGSEPGDGGGSNSSPGTPVIPVPDLEIKDWQDLTLFESSSKTKSLSDAFALRTLVLVFPNCLSRETCTQWWNSLLAKASSGACNVVVLPDFIDYIRFWSGTSGAYYSALGATHVKARLRADVASRVIVLDREMTVSAEGDDAQAMIGAHCR